MKHIFIVNPKSGNGQYVKVIEQIENYFTSSEDYEIHMTEYEGHAKVLAAQFSKDVRLYSVGGDGTAHEVLNGLEEGIAMGVIPAGSGNDFNRNIIPKRQFDTIVQDMVEGRAIDVDYVLFNNKKQLNCANVGFDAIVNKNVNASKLTLLPRKFLYALFALKGLIDKNTIDIEIECDGKVSHHTVLLTSFMNGRFYGGGFQSAPTANLQDGLLDVTLISNVSRLRILKLLPVYYQGKHLGIDIVNAFRTSSITIRSAQVMDVGCDGELESLKEFNLKVVPQGLQLILPQGSSLMGQSDIEK